MLVAGAAAAAAAPLPVPVATAADRASVRSAAPAAAAAPPVHQLGASCVGTVRVRCTWGQDGFLTVPPGVTAVRVEAAGGAGGDGGPRPGSTGASGEGGRGTEVTADVAVRPGQRLDVAAGRRGSDGLSRRAVDGGAGAGRGGGGGYGESAGGGGGGASRVSTAGVPAVVAAGGGGGGGKGSPTSRGGDGQGPGPVTGAADGGPGARSQHAESGSGGGGGGLRGGQAGAPGDDGFLYSSGAYGGHAGTSVGPPSARIDPGAGRADGRVVLSFDDPPDRPARTEAAVGLAVSPPAVAGRPATLSVTVTNRGTGPIDTTDTEVYSHSVRFVDGTRAWRVDLDGGPLAPGASSTTTVRIVPLGVGSASISALTTARGPGGVDVARRNLVVAVAHPDD